MQDPKSSAQKKTKQNLYKRKKIHELLDELLGTNATKVRRLYTQYDVCMHPTVVASTTAASATAAASTHMVALRNSSAVEAQAIAKANKEHANLLATNSPKNQNSADGSQTNEISGVLWIIQESISGIVYVAWTPYSVIASLNEELYLNTNIHRKGLEATGSSNRNSGIASFAFGSGSGSGSGEKPSSIMASFSPFGRKRSSSKGEFPATSPVDVSATENDTASRSPALDEGSSPASDKRDSSPTSAGAAYVSAVVSPTGDSNTIATASSPSAALSPSSKFERSGRQSSPVPTASVVLKANPSHLHTFVVDLRDVLSIQRNVPRMGWAHITLTQRNGKTHGPLYFHDGGINNFFECLKKTAALASIDSGNSASTTESFRVGSTSAERSTLVEPLEHSLSSLQFDEYLGDVYKGNRSLSWQLFEWGSKVTKSLRDTKDTLLSTLSATPLPPSTPAAAEITAAVAPKSTPIITESTTVQTDKPKDQSEEQQQQQQQELINGLPRRLANQPVAATAKTKPTVATETTDSIGQDDFEMISGHEQDADPDDFPFGGSMSREPPLTREKWESYFTADGRISDEKALRRDIFYGGVSDDIRKEVWMFLLGFYPMNSTRAERDALLFSKTQEYERYKLQWTSITPQQEQQFKKFRERRARVEKDVVRTDRTVDLYKPITEDDPSDESNAVIGRPSSVSSNLADVIRGHEMLRRMHDILLTYTFYNFDIGYCQGMNDILSPILAVIQSEAESFWCFTNLMVVMQRNFQRDQNGMSLQLQQLLELVKVMLPRLYAYFESHECLNMFFCFRWLLVQFKRELPDFNDVQRLWEVLWSQYYTRDFHLFVALALLSQHADYIIANELEFDALLKFINELSGKIDVDATLEQADALFHDYQAKARRGVVTVIDA